MTPDISFGSLQSRAYDRSKRYIKEQIQFLINVLRENGLEKDELLQNSLLLIRAILRNATQFILVTTRPFPPPEKKKKKERKKERIRY